MKIKTIAAACIVAAVASLSEAAVVDVPVSGEVTIGFINKALSYGFVDGDEPLFVPSGKLMFFDWYSAGAIFYIDTTPYGRKAGRGNRAWDFWEIDFPTEFRHSFGPDDFSWLPTTVEIGVGYRYEYHPRRSNYNDTQFWTFDISLPDLWLVPTFAYERDTIKDNGTYLNFSVRHGFELVDTLTLTPFIAQGFGNGQRVKGYVKDDNGKPLDHAGLMDTSIGLDLEWSPKPWLKISGFVAYNEFLFDRKIRHAARHYISDAAGYRVDETSWHFTTGISVTFSF